MQPSKLPEARPLARERYLATRAIYNGLGQPANAANAQLHAAQVDLSLGDVKGALAQLEPALEIFRHYQSGQDETAALCSIGRARFVLGEHEQAVRDLEAAVRRSETTLEHHAAIAGRAYLAEALWQSDRARDEELLDAALRIGEERQMAAEPGKAALIERAANLDAALCQCCKMRRIEGQKQRGAALERHFENVCVVGPPAVPSEAMLASMAQHSCPVSPSTCAKALKFSYSNLCASEAATRCGAGNRVMTAYASTRTGTGRMTSPPNAASRLSTAEQ